MQIVPELDTAMLSGDLKKISAGEECKAEGFIGILMNVQSKFSQMLKEDPALVLAEMESYAEHNPDDKDSEAADNSIMASGWLNTNPDNPVEKAAISHSDKIMIGEKTGSLYGNMQVTAGKENPLMTGSRLLRSFGVSRNPEGNTEETTAKDIWGKITVKPETTIKEEVVIAKNELEMTERIIAEKAADESVVKAKNPEAVKSEVIPDELLKKYEFIRGLKMTGRIKPETTGQQASGEVNGKGHAVSNPGRIISRMASEMDTIGREIKETVHSADSVPETAGKEMVKNIADYVMKETIRTGLNNSELPDVKETVKNDEITNGFTSGLKNAADGMTETVIAAETGENVLINARDNVVQQLIEKVSIHRMEDGSSINVKLRPDSLGSIAVSLEMTSKGLTATIAATNPEVQSSLAGSLGQLASVLAEYGISSDSIEVVAGEGFYGEQETNGFMFDDGRQDGSEYNRPGSNRHHMEQIEEENTDIRRTGKDMSIINVYG